MTAIRSQRNLRGTSTRVQHYWVALRRHEIEQHDKDAPELRPDCIVCAETARTRKLERQGRD